MLFLAFVGFGGAIIVFGLSHNFWLSMAMLVLTGAFDNLNVVIRQTLVQFITPDAMRGRVSSVNFLFIGCSNELGRVRIRRLPRISSAQCLPSWEEASGRSSSCSR